MSAETRPPTPPSDALTEAFLRLLLHEERGIAAYVHSLVPHAADAQDLLQEVRVTLWKHFAKFQPGSHFGAWARKIALHHILNYRRASKRHSPLDTAFIESVAAEIDRHSDSLEARSEALRLCLQQLPEPSRHLILWRYYEEFGIEEIATKTRRSVDAVYQFLSRVRSLLHDCVRRRLASPS